jgi:hypothetical protein
LFILAGTRYLESSEFNFGILVFKGLKTGRIYIIEMRTCLSSFSDFFKDLACVPHDTIKNVEETKPPACLNEVKNDPPKEEPKNTLDENDEVEEVDSVYDDTPTDDDRTSALEACLILAPLILGVVYSYMMTSIIYNK